MVVLAYSDFVCAMFRLSGITEPIQRQSESLHFNLRNTGAAPNRHAAARHKIVNLLLACRNILVTEKSVQVPKSVAHLLFH